jgi:hypothetical protein
MSSLRHNDNNLDYKEAATITQFVNRIVSCSQCGHPHPEFRFDANDGSDIVLLVITNCIPPGGEVLVQYRLEGQQSQPSATPATQLG